MKASKIVVLPLAYAACLVMIANSVQAKVSTNDVPSVNDMTEWTKDQVQGYLNKYQIAYDKNTNDETIFQTAQRYRNAALANADYFISDKKDGINRLIDGLKIKLEKNYKLSTNNVGALSDDISHELKQLELSGSLTQDKVKQSMDKLQHNVLSKKYVTQAQWKEIASDIESSFNSPAWYQRMFGAPSTSSQFDQDSFHTWLASSVTQRLQDNKELTKEQVDIVISTLQNAITSTSSSIQDLSKLSTASWWKQFSKDLQKQAKIKQHQADDVVAALTDEVNAYKIFAMDYAGEAANNSQHYFAIAQQYLMDTSNQLYEKVVSTLKGANKDASAAATSATDTAAASAASLTDAAAASIRSAASDMSASASSATDAAGASASSLHHAATQSAYDAKDSFGRFWRQKELEAYRKVGYTEAHIDWVENYLSKTFHDKTNLAKETVQTAIRTVRQYLIQAKVQTAAHVDAQLKSLEAMIESWRRSTVRDEL